MRLDLFLRKTRIIKTRSRSKEFIQKKYILVNGSPTKPARNIKPQDTISIDFGKRRLTITVEKIPGRNVPKSEAALYYTIIEDEPVDII
jgi:ribosome-associated heat shock protein Hsp15